MPDEKLKTYRRKRDFEASPEPAGDGQPAAGTAPRFTVQEHHARRLHWDLRLEHDGALASWAIPNGIPPEPADNRLAVRTEDHPMEYLEFEGEIPAGEYGAGTIRIWDTGTFEQHKWAPNKVEITFHGERLDGRYGLFPDRARGGFRAARRRRSARLDDPPHGSARRPRPPADARADRAHAGPRGDRAPPAREGLVVRGQVGRGPGDRLCPPGPPAAGEPQPQRDHRLLPGGARPVARSWHARGGARRRDRRLRRRRPAELRAAPEPHARHLAGSGPPPARGPRRSCTRSSTCSTSTAARCSTFPTSERRARLEALELGGRAWRVPAAHRGRRDAPARGDATAQGLEGVVAKRLDSGYEPGRRSGAWLKIKHTLRQEFVIGGWLPGEGRRTERIGALLMGVLRRGRAPLRRPRRDRLHRADPGRARRRFAPLRASRSPFDARRKLPREAVFVEPRLVAEVEFREWTAEGVMRAPSFKGLRDDKPADVVREGDGDSPAPGVSATRPRAEPSRGSDRARRCSTRSSGCPRARCA